MIRALRTVGHAIKLWYDEVYILVFVNIVWFLLQIPLVTGPAATATMYAVARKVVDREYLELRTILSDLRGMFLPALTWGFVNLIMIGVLVANFMVYQAEYGLVWGVLRVVWGSIALIWIGANLFYWPFWLAQTDRRLITTFKNCIIFLLKNPVFSLSILVVCTVFVVVGTIMTVPLVVLLISWLALIGVLAVEEGLKVIKSNESSETT
jgi:uncharacterized membrane protein YesL